MKKFLQFASRLQNLGIHLCRMGLVVVLLWIGGLKFFKYEANGIVPFVSNSPFMSFFYINHDATVYKANAMAEGAYDKSKVNWHSNNHTYLFSYGLGICICLIGLLIAMYPISKKISAVGSLLAFLMSLVTLSFLITTPQVWVSNLSPNIIVPLQDQNYGFPFLTGAGRLVIKDVIMLGAAIVTMAQAAKKAISK